MDPKSGKIFYYNRKTKTSTWKKPENLNELLDTSLNNNYNHEGITSTSSINNINSSSGSRNVHSDKLQNNFLKGAFLKLCN